MTSPEPPPVLTSRPEQRHRRWCWGTRLLVGAATAWLLFVGLHYLLSGRWWVWTFVELGPPLMFLVVPLLLLAGPVLVRLLRVRLPSRASRVVVLLAVAALGAGAGMTNFNLHALRSVAGAAPSETALQVFVWNTEHWEQWDDRDAHYAYLKAQDADIYLLQEYAYNGRIAPYSIDDSIRLRQEFPDYELVAFGEFLTLSRVPIVGWEPLFQPEESAFRTSAWDDYWLAKTLRVDVRVGNETLSLYNVHIPTPVNFHWAPGSGQFLEYIRQAHAWRQAAFDVLVEDLSGNCRPIVLAGDFNATHLTPQLRRLPEKLTDAISVNGALYPTTYSIPRTAPAVLWRLDYAYTTPELQVHEYELLNHQGLSDHKAQRLVVSLSGDGPSTGAECHAGEDG